MNKDVRRFLTLLSIMIIEALILTLLNPRAEHISIGFVLVLYLVFLATTLLYCKRYWIQTSPQRFLLSILPTERKGIVEFLVLASAVWISLGGLGLAIKILLSDEHVSSTVLFTLLVNLHLVLSVVTAAQCWQSKMEVRRKFWWFLCCCGGFIVGPLLWMLWGRRIGEASK